MPDPATLSLAAKAAVAVATDKQYMEKKDFNVQTELTATMDKLYEKFVPAALREFIEFNATGAAAQTAPVRNTAARTAMPTRTDVSPQNTL